ncbi:DUF4358 domain-containing protein [Ileibacterium valens]|uniref:DUF4358 domain-containing protein n=2 Tax=Ileibacterium valens TaxID=1862668 RepID=UPI002355861D|nr:DUF4358 domain-containing protein [Ileibacterium valens]
MKGNFTRFQDLKTGRQEKNKSRNKTKPGTILWMNGLKVGTAIFFLALWIIPWIRQPIVSSSEFSLVEQAVLAVNDPAFYPAMNDQMVRKYLNIGPQEGVQIGFYRQSDAFSAREIVIAKFDTEQQAEMITERIETRKQAQIDIYSGYAPEQQAMMENALLDVQGNYILFYTGDAAAQSDQAFLDALRGNH